jgi:O-antigen/teichoic acid export membrane protein
MALIMCVGLYTVRAILDLLGVTDYGIYNVVGGVVGMFSFLSGTLATSSQRYFSIAIADGNLEKLRRQFSLNITIYLYIIIGVVILLETVGLWFLNYRVNIPADRLSIANVVYQISIVTFAVQLMTVPYNAMVISYEKMSAFAYIGICEALFKLVIVFILSAISYDKLMIYGWLILISNVGIAVAYIIYCKRRLQGSDYHYYWNASEAIQLFKFTGWHFLGTISVVVRSQGINLLISVFFAPAVNAARAIAYQVYSAISQLAGNFFVAVKPQMYKAYANNELSALYTLINRSTAICVFLVSIMSVPVVLNTDYILSIWLKDVPDYAVIFTILVIANGIIDSTGNSTICPALATGNIKKFYIVTGSLYILNLPISYVFLKFGCAPTITMIVSTVISMVTVVMRAVLLKELIAFPLKPYFSYLIKLFGSTAVIIGITYILCATIDHAIIKLIVAVISSVVLHVGIYMIFILSKDERKIFTTYLRTKICHKR